MTVPGLAERLHSVAIRLLRQVRSEDAASGLTAARLSALSVLVFGGPRTVSQLADAEQVALPTMTRLLQGMEREALVRRRRDRADARVVHVSATAVGRRALEAARERRVRRLEDVVRTLDGTEIRRVAAAVALLERALAARPASDGTAESAASGRRGQSRAQSATGTPRRATRAPPPRRRR